MNGHIQLSISLKDHEQIKDAVGLLFGLLTTEERAEIVVVRGQFKKVETPIPPFVLTQEPPYVQEETKLMGVAPKQPSAPKHDRVYRDAKGNLRTHKGTDTLLKEKFRQNALKRKRDATGHFLPGKNVSKK